MLNSLVVLAILQLFVVYEIVLSVSSVFGHPRLLELSEFLCRKVVRQIFGLMRLYCGVRLEYENLSGSELPPRFLLVSNHQSLLDIPVYFALFPDLRLRFVAKRELGNGFPFVSRILRSQGHALIRRTGDAKQAMRQLRRFAIRCSEDSSNPVIFPEGTRSRDGEVGDFYTAGVRKVLELSPLPLVVAVLDGGWRIASIKGIFRNLRGARYRIRLLSVSGELSGKREVLEALSDARKEIVAGLEALRREERR